MIMRYPFRPDPVIRISFPEITGVERRTYRQQPHPRSTIEAVRQLVEGTRLTFKTIGHRTGVNSGTISRWVEKYDWTRPEGAAPLNRRPERRWVRPMHGRILASRLRIQAERLLRYLESDPQVDPKALEEGLRLLAQARDEQKIRTPARQPPPRSIVAPEQPGRRTKKHHDRVAAALKGWGTRYTRLEARHRAMLEE